MGSLHCRFQKWPISLVPSPVNSISVQSTAFLFKEMPFLLRVSSSTVTFGSVVNTWSSILKFSLPIQLLFRPKGTRGPLAKLRTDATSENCQRLVEDYLIFLRLSFLTSTLGL